jgi:N6-adenosine-specific RNA methylase IME4
VPVRIVAFVDEREYVLRAALMRRELSPSQRAALALELESCERARSRARTRQRQNLRVGAEVATLPPEGKTRDYVAELAGVSARTVQDAETVRQHDPELFERIKAGDLAAHLAARRVRRRQRDSTLVAPPALPAGPFDLLYVDPPWELGSPDSAKAPENHYPTMPDHEIKDLRLPAGADSILFLWAVNARLPLAIEVMEVWGFVYRTNLVWVKPSIGLGHWARNQHELLLVGTRGNARAPEPEDRPPSVIDARRGAHSEKPDDVYELIERAYPRLTKLEIFARRSRRGWASWGNEAPK